MAAILLLPCLPALSEPSTRESGGSTICFSDSEWAALEATIQAEAERMVREAVAAALVDEAKRWEMKVYWWRLGAMSAALVAVVSIAGWIITANTGHF